jgi:hypothetical protein
MICFYHVRLIIVVLLTTAALGCAKREPKFTIVNLTTGQGINVLNKPIPNTITVIVQVRNDGTIPGTIFYGSEIGRVIRSVGVNKKDAEKKSAVTWCLVIEARYEDGGKWGELQGMSAWSLVGSREMMSLDNQLSMKPGQSASFSVLVAQSGMFETPKPKEVRVFLTDPQGKPQSERVMKP